MKSPLMQALKYSLILITFMYIILSIPLILLYPNISFILKFLNEMGLITLLGMVVSFEIALFVYFSQLEEKKKEQKNEQKKLLDSLIAELKIISHQGFETYFGHTKGNIQWYKEEIEKNQPNTLDYPINQLSFQNYITKFDSNICKKIKFEKLIRSLSYLNDKVFEINNHTEKLKELKDN